MTGELPLKRVPRAQLPEEPRRWLDKTATLPRDVTYLQAKASSDLVLVVAAAVLLGFVLVAAVQLVLPSRVLALVMVGAVPLVTMLWWRRHQRRVRASQAASPWRLGLMLGPGELLWAPSIDECTLLARARLEPIEDFVPLGGDSIHRRVRIVQEVPDEQRRVLIELFRDDLEFKGDARALAKALEAWRTGT